jgi:FkbM family methyltransferase
MRNALDYAVVGSDTVLGTIMVALRSRGIDLMRVVDVGARNGMFLLPHSLAEHTELIGFEPNPDEHQKLVNGTTDAAGAGERFPTFKRQRFFQSAAWDVDGTGTFYITAGVGACTMMGEVLAPVAGRIFQRYPATDRRAGRSFLECHGEVQRTIEVPTQRLDSVLDGEVVDFLKLDVEGGELRVMRGAERLFQQQKVLLVYTEFTALQFYREHPVLGDQHSFLRDRGFRLLDLELGHTGYSRGQTRLDADADRPLMHAGDAIFCLDPDLNDLAPETRLRLAVMCFAFGFNSLAISLLRDSKLIADDRIDQIEAALRRVPLARRLARGWRRFPYRVAAALRSVGVRP